MSSDRMRILITWPCDLGGLGGGTVGLLEIIRALRRAGVDVVLIAVHSRGKDQRRLLRAAQVPEDFTARDQARVAELRELGVEVHKVKASAVHYLFDGLAVRAVLRPMIERGRIDAVLGWEQELLPLLPLLRAAGIRSAMFAAGRYDQPIPLRWAWRSARGYANQTVNGIVRGRLLRAVDAVLAISEYTKGMITRRLGVDPARVRVAPWGVDPMFARAERPPAEKIEHFLFFGSPDPRKGGHDAVRAFAALAQRGPRDWRLEVIWERASEVARVAADLGIGDLVEARAPMSQAELAHRLAAAQVAVLPSTFESFGLACAEAQASGVPVVAYDVGGVREVVTDGETGWIVPPRRIDLLTDALAEAIADPARTRAMGLAGRARVQERYSWDRTAAAIMELARG